MVDMVKDLFGDGVIQRGFWPSKSPYDICSKSLCSCLKESVCQKPASNTNSGKQNKEFYCQEIAILSEHTEYLNVSATDC